MLAAYFTEACHPVQSKVTQAVVLLLKYTDHLKLVDWTVRILSDDKRSAIQEDTPEILNRLKIQSKYRGYLTKDFESPFKSLVGSVHEVRQACEQIGKLTQRVTFFL